MRERWERHGRVARHPMIPSTKGLQRPKGQCAMTADILRDYMLGRLTGTERNRVGNRLRVDPNSRDRLRRLRNTTVRVRARVGRVDTIRQLPREWLTLVRGSRCGHARAKPSIRRRGCVLASPKTTTVR